MELNSQLEFDLKDTIEFGEMWFVTLNAGKV